MCLRNSSWRYVHDDAPSWYSRWRQMTKWKWMRPVEGHCSSHPAMPMMSCSSLRERALAMRLSTSGMHTVPSMRKGDQKIIWARSVVLRTFTGLPDSAVRSITSLRLSVGRGRGELMVLRK